MGLLNVSMVRRVVIAGLIALAALAATLARPGSADALVVGFLDPSYQSQDGTEVLGRHDAPCGPRWSATTSTGTRSRRRGRASPAIRPRRSTTGPNLDRLVTDSAAHGADIVLTLWRTPRWARADNGRGGKPNLYSWAPRIADWRAFVYAAAVRYSGTFDPDGPDGYGTVAAARAPLGDVERAELHRRAAAAAEGRQAHLADDLHRHPEHGLRRDRPRRARAQAQAGRARRRHEPRLRRRGQHLRR